MLDRLQSLLVIFAQNHHHLRLIIGALQQTHAGNGLVEVGQLMPQRRALRARTNVITPSLEQCNTGAQLLPNAVVLTAQRLLLK